MAHSRPGTEQDTELPDTGGPVAGLEKLAAEIGADGAHWTKVLTPQGGKPYLHVRNKAHQALTVNVYSDGQWFRWPWDEPITMVTDVPAAASTVRAVVRALEQT